MRRLVLFAVITLAATTALGQMQGMQPVVAPDGTVVVKRPAVSLTGMTMDLVAVSPSGAVRWTWESAAVMHAIVLSETRVFVAVSASRPASHPMAGRGAQAEEVAALTLATGAVQWKQQLPGPVAGIEAAGDRVYALLSAGSSTSRGHMFRDTAGPATLVALDAATGAILWTTPLQ